MFQKTIVRVGMIVLITFAVSILFVSAKRNHGRSYHQASDTKAIDGMKTSIYGEYIIWESLGNTSLVVEF